MSLTDNDRDHIATLWERGEKLEAQRYMLDRLNEGDSAWGELFATLLWFNERKRKADAA